MRVYVEKQDEEFILLIDTEFIPAKGDLIILGTEAFTVRKRVIRYDSVGRLEEIYLKV